jgi:hypothetical protein
VGGLLPLPQLRLLRLLLHRRAQEGNLPVLLLQQLAGQRRLGLALPLRLVQVRLQRLVGF